MTALPELCFYPSTCARAPLIVLEEIGVPYKLRVVGLMTGENRTEDYLAINPTGKVPALILPDGALTQNPAILMYLARHYPEAELLPTTSSALEEARLAADLMRFSADLHPLVTRIARPQTFSDVPGGAQDVCEKATVIMVKQLADIEKRLGQGIWYLGDRWSVFDAYLFWIWFRITGAGFDPSPFPNLVRHHQQMHDRPAVQRALARERAAEEELTARSKPNAS